MTKSKEFTSEMMITGYVILDISNKSWIIFDEDTVYSFEKEYYIKSTSNFRMISPYFSSGIANNCKFAKAMKLLKLKHVFDMKELIDGKGLSVDRCEIIWEREESED